MQTIAQAIGIAEAELRTLAKFISPMQATVLRALFRGEEGEWFRERVAQLAALVAVMPTTYQQDGQGDEAKAYLHYFYKGADWFITEKDIETADEPGQHQAFGVANLGYGAELGYISIAELIANNVELDLHFQPRTLGAIQKAAR